MSRSLIGAGTAVLCLAPVQLVACGSEGGAGSTTNFEIQVAPLTLPGINEAEYRLTVDNALLETVWSQTITSTRYGDGKGAATYIGTCDASPGANPHTVELELLSLSAVGQGTLGTADFANPAPVGSPVIVTATCRENADTPVRIDLAIMRSARQGFFDIAVNFEDVFCSAKVDCGADGRSLLLFDPDTNERAPTVVIGYACTAGDDQPTYLYLSDVTVDCPAVGDDAVDMVLDPGRSELGNQGTVDPAVYEWGLYRGVEFEQAEVDFDKCFTNVAIGLRTAYMNGKTCTIRGVGTAASTLWDGGRIPDNVVYPVVQFAVEVTGQDDKLVCTPTNHALNADGSQVSTEYVKPGQARPRFSQAMSCATGDVLPLGEVVCSGSVPGHPGQSVVVEPLEAGVVRIAVGGTSAEYRLPSAYDDGSGVVTPVAGVGTTCCADPCCQ
jgi:hypothetical protein